MVREKTTISIFKRKIQAADKVATWPPLKATKLSSKKVQVNVGWKERKTENIFFLAKKRNRI